MRNTQTTEEFINKLISKYGYKYDYSDVKYINQQTKIKIICPVHGEFKISPNNHLNGRGCPKCGVISSTNKRRLTSEDFINNARKIHNDKYDYSLVKYINNYTKIQIKCPHHGTFEQTPASHLNSQGCEDCSLISRANKRRKTIKEFIKEAKVIHNNKYDYSLSVYINTDTKIKIICPVFGHKIFEQKPDFHLRGQGCPVCNESKGEKEIRFCLENNKINYIPQYKFNDCRYKNPLPFDFYLPDLNTCIEFDGEQHFKEKKAWGGQKEFKLIKKRDTIKTKYCSKNNIKLIRISYKEVIELKLFSLLTMN